MTELKTKFLALRVTPTLKERFTQKALKYGDPSDIHRELIEAFVEDRLEVKQPDHKETLYVS